MIPYHGTPIGGSRQDVARFMRTRHVLIPYERPDDLPIAMECSQSFIVDNSAWSRFKEGKGRVDFTAYAQWVAPISHHPRFDWCLIPDIIDGTEDENYRWARKWLEAGWRINGVPVWHLHESTAYLGWLVRNFERIAIGSSGKWSTPGTQEWWSRMEEVRSTVCYADDSPYRGSPQCKLHGLRMLDPEIFTRLPFSSADSTNAAVNQGSLSRFGMYLPPTAAQRAAVIADRIEAHSSAHIWERQAEQRKLFA